MAQLPRFSRNYGRSGAYENPATVVDTKTAQIWANVIDNLIQKQLRYGLML